jgi:hypothetical protein
MSVKKLRSQAFSDWGSLQEKPYFFSHNSTDQWTSWNLSFLDFVTTNLKCNMIFEVVSFSSHTYTYLKCNGERCYLSQTSVKVNVWDLHNGQPTKLCSYVLTVKRDKQLWHIINRHHTSVVQFWCSWLVRAGVRKWWWGRMWSDECTNWRTSAKINTSILQNVKYVIQTANQYNW